MINQRSAIRRKSRLVFGAIAASALVPTVIVASAGAAVRAPRTVVDLNLYSAQGYDSSVVAAFNASHPTIHVTLDDDSTGPLITKITAEEASGSPVWNMFWADGATWAAAFDTNGWLAKGIVPSTVRYNALGMANLPADKNYAPTGVTVTGGLCYDKTAVANDHITLPTTWAGLVNLPSGSFGMNDPSYSGPTFPLIASLMAHLGGISSAKNPTAVQLANAVHKGEQFLLALKAKGLQVHHTNGPTLGAMESNPASLDMAMIQTSACYGDVAAGYWPTGGVKYLDYSSELPSSIAVSKTTTGTKLAAAKTFVAYVLSTTGQLAMQHGDPQGDGLFWPVVTGVNPESQVPAFSTTKAFAINPYIWGPLQDGIDAWFTAKIVN